MEKSTIKIALTGPESVGKSTLSSYLASYFNTVHTVEFARKYLEDRNNKYTYEDIIFMAKQQLALENKMEQKAHQVLFCDTDFINFKIWLEHVGHKVPSWLEKHIASKPYKLSLLLKPDIPWEKDSLRAFPHKRDYFFDLFKSHLDYYEYDYKIIDGIGKNRFHKALEAISNLKSSR